MTTKNQLDLELFYLEFVDTIRGYKSSFEDDQNVSDAHRGIARRVQTKPLVERLSKKLLERLERDIVRVLARFIETLEWPNYPDPELLYDEGMLWLDAQLIRFVEQFTPTGVFYADLVREKSSELCEELPLEELLQKLASNTWPTWKPTDEAKWPKCFLDIAYAYFIDELQPELELEERHRKNNPPGLQHEVYRALSQALFTPSNKVTQGTSRPFVVVDSVDHPVAYSPPDLAQNLPATKTTKGELEAGIMRRLQLQFQESLKLLRSVTTHRLMRWAANECATKYLKGKSFEECRNLRWEGGMEVLAAAIGESSPGSGKVQHKIRRILQAGRCIEIAWPGGGRIGGMWLERFFAPRPNRPAIGELDVAPFFVPGFTRRYKLPNRQIVPVVPLPPGIQRAHPSHQGPLAACQFELVAMMTERKVELVYNGGVLVEPKERAYIADLYGIRRDVFEKYLELWQHETDSGPAMLEKIDGDRFALADNELFGDAHTFLLRGGRRNHQARSKHQKDRKNRKNQPK